MRELAGGWLTPHAYKHDTNKAMKYSIPNLLSWGVRGAGSNLTVNSVPSPELPSPLLHSELELGLRKRSMLSMLTIMNT